MSTVQAHDDTQDRDDLDPDLVARVVNQNDQTAAVRAIRQVLRV